MKPLMRVLFISVGFLIAIYNVNPYESIGGTYREYVRVLALLEKSEWTPRSFNRYSDHADYGNLVERDHLWNQRLSPDLVERRLFNPIDPQLSATVNTHVPHNRNNQGQWEGRGLNTALGGGGEITTDSVSVVLAPEVWYAQNLEFNTIASDSSYGSDFGDYFRGLDRPQRFGDAQVANINWGQSSIRFTRWNATVGLSTENVWLGPARDNPIVLSNNAPGFPHLDIGTDGPINTRFGRIEANTWWGYLPRSDHFESDLDPNALFNLGYAIGYEPPYIHGLYLGFNRMYLSPMETVDQYKVFQHFDGLFKANRSDVFEEDDINQVASVTAHWFLPAAGFEVYLEWARWDHTSDIDDLILNPEHAAAYTLGFQKAFDFRDFYLVLEGEISRLGNNETTTYGSPRRTSPIYRHYRALGGYTNEGQILGAWIGTASNSQFVGVRSYYRDGEIYGRIQRHAFDNDYYLEYLRGSTSDGYDVRMLYSLGATRFFDDLDLSAEITQHHLRNWYWSEDSPNWNTTIGISARYHL